MLKSHIHLTYVKYKNIHKHVCVCIYIYIYILCYSGGKTTPLSKKYFDMMSSTVSLQLNFYLQKFIFYNTKINYSNH